MTRVLLVLCLAGLAALWLPASPSAEGAEGYDYGDPTPEEQLLLELINRARADPAAEGDRLGLDLSSYDPMPPLTMEKRLLAAARAHAADMADRRFFSHENPDGKNADERVRDTGYLFPPEYDDPSVPNHVENIRVQGPSGVEAAHRGFMQSSGHRDHILSATPFKAANDEAGIAFLDPGKDVVIDGVGRVREFIVEEIARDPDPTPYVTGVVYRDADGDGFYDPGEGLSGVTVATTDGSYSTTTASAGGYGIPVAAAGSYTLRASGGALAEAIEVPFTIGSKNVKVDFRESPPPVFEVLKSKFKVDWGKRAKKGTPEVDSLKLTALLDPARLPASLDGARVTIHYAGLTLGPYTLAGKGKGGVFKSAKGTLPKVSVKLSAKTAKLTVKISKADLAAGLPVSDVTEEKTESLDIRVVLGGTYDAARTVLHTVKSKAGKKSAGRY